MDNSAHAEAKSVLTAHGMHQPDTAIHTKTRQPSHTSTSLTNYSVP